MARQAPEKILDVFEAAGSALLSQKGLAARWGLGMFLGWIAVFAAGAGMAWRPVAWLMEDAKRMESPLDSTWFVPAVLAASFAFVLVLAMATAQVISGVRAAAEIWEGAPSRGAAGYWLLGWREVVTSIPFYLRGAWYLVWPAAPIAAGVATLGVVGAAGERWMTVPAAALSIVGGVALLAWTVGRSFRLQLATYASCWTGDWSKEAFAAGVAMSRGKFWVTFWRLLGMGMMWSVASNMLSLPASAVSGIFVQLLSPALPHAAAGTVPEVWAAFAAVPLTLLLASLVGMFPLALYGLTARRLAQDAPAPQAATAA